MNSESYTVSSPTAEMNAVEDNICATYENNILMISDRTHSRSIYLDIDKLLGVDKITFKIQLKEFEFNKILLVKELPESEEVLIVYTNRHTLSCVRKINKGQSPLKQFVKVKFKVLNMYVNKSSAMFTYVALISNPYNLNVANAKIFLDEKNILPVDISIGAKLTKSKIKLLRSVKMAKFEMSSLLHGGEPPINSQIKLMLDVDNIQTLYSANTPQILRPNSRRLNYVPVSSCYTKEHAIHFRYTFNGTPTLVRRRKEAIENSTKFRFFESSVISSFLYFTARLSKILSNKKHNIYFEKFAGKAEEGTYEVFCKSKESNVSKNHFIIDSSASDYSKIKSSSNVIEKFSFAYYWYLFRADNIISTEAPSHANILRGNNKYVRKSLITSRFIFLQHGITYMKNQDKKGGFSINREAEPDYMVVNSEKEKNIVAKMLGLPHERLLNVGMPAFDNVRYNYISANSKDVVTIMLTWKPYEEHLNDFSLTSYYYNSIALADIVKQVALKTEIRVVAHPKVYDLLNRTSLSEHLWQGTISDALKDTKLLITDYSSVCYNSFYRGSGVIFFQPDLEKYEEETGPLIPEGSEYIGHRCFSILEFKKIIEESIIEGEIDLAILRNSSHEKNYKAINQYYDGQNVDRLYKELVSLEII